MQLADELPMIYATCIIGHATFSYGKSPAVSNLIGAGLFSLGLTITVVYHITKEPVFHQVSFAALTCAVVFRSMFDMEKQLRPALKVRCPERANAIMSQMWKMCLSGIALFLVGFFIWNLDNIFCSYLRQWRNVLLLPWSIVLEGHAWWHIFTGLGMSRLCVAPSPSPFSIQSSYFLMWLSPTNTSLGGTYKHAESLSNVGIYSLQLLSLSPVPSHKVLTNSQRIISSSGVCGFTRVSKQRRTSLRCSGHRRSRQFLGSCPSTA